MSLISLKMYPFRLYRHKLNTLTCVIPELDEGNTCPACPKVLKMISLIILNQYVGLL